MQKTNSNKYLLVINCGSATLKFKLFNYSSLKPELEGNLERIGLTKPFLKIWGEEYKSKVTVNYPKGVKNHSEATKLVFKGLKTCGIDLKDVETVGHRVVHGGDKFTKPVKINKQILKKIEDFSSLAPLHNPINIKAINSAIKELPKAKQVAVFDTAFYKTLPDFTKIYSIPYEFYEKHKIRKYGFHGISHEYVSKQAALVLNKPLSKINLITCHLGSGCSITAISKGKAIDTSMGFTPLEGLMMSTRSGSIDPAIILHLQRELKMTIKEIDDLLQKKSGLIGIAGTSDMREILLAAGYSVPGFILRKKFSKEERKKSKLALKMFIYRIQKYISAYANLLGSVDAIVFTAGIGERNFTIRKMVLRGLKLLKVLKFKVLVIEADEELAIATKVKEVI